MMPEHDSPKCAACRNQATRMMHVGRGSDMTRVPMCDACASKMHMYKNKMGPPTQRDEDPMASFPAGATLPAELSGWIAHHVNNALTAFTDGIDGMMDAGTLTRMRHAARRRISMVLELLEKAGR